jgi:hypothetical protein
MARTRVPTTLRQALFAPVLFTAFGLFIMMMMGVARDQGARLTDQGVTVTGEVIARHEEITGTASNRRVYRALEVRYETEAGVVERRFALPQMDNDWRGHDVGGPVFVRYVPGETLAVLPGFQSRGDGIALPTWAIPLIPIGFALIMLVRNLTLLRRSRAGAHAPTD